MQVRSPGSWPITFVRHRVSPKVRPVRFVCRRRFQRSFGKRRCTVRLLKTSTRQVTVAGYARSPQSDLKASWSAWGIFATAWRIRWMMQRWRSEFGKIGSIAAIKPGGPSETMSSGGRRYDRSRCANVANSSLIRWQIRLTVERDSVASSPSTSLSAASTSRSDSPRSHADTTKASRAAARQTEVEQCRAEALVGVSELRSGELDLARRRLHRGGRLLAVARAGRVLLVATLMTAASQERIDLGLDRLLHKKADGDAPDLLEDASELAIAAEQRVHLCANALAGGYSRCHGCRSSFVSWCS